MRPLEALIILREYDAMPYKGRAASTVCSKAHKVLTEAATKLMQEECSDLCITCWGDGFHRVSNDILSGPCEACNGSGTRRSGE
jgi:DnaJ-class molecular chaperone